MSHILHKPRYHTISSARLREISEQLDILGSPCRLCPRRCRAERTAGIKGICRGNALARVASWNLHHGEEPPVSGQHGSGTIFFSGCSLGCIFCQNYPISHLGHGEEFSDEGLAGCMMHLQKRGAHNINLVTPTHVLPSIIRALRIARDRGLALPIVYNSSGYEVAETIDLLGEIVDIYMPDAKYASKEAAARYSGAPDYPEHNRASLKTMFNQVGDLILDENGIAVRGLLVRHLVLPGNTSETEEILKFLHDEISSSLYVSLMAQYHPAHRSHTCAELASPLKPDEYRKALQIAERLGLENGWRQQI